MNPLVDLQSGFVNFDDADRPGPSGSSILARNLDNFASEEESGGSSILQRDFSPIDFDLRSKRIRLEPVSPELAKETEVKFDFNSAETKPETFGESSVSAMKFGEDSTKIGKNRVVSTGNRAIIEDVIDREAVPLIGRNF